MFFESKSIVLVALRSEGNNLKEMLNIKKKQPLPLKLGASCNCLKKNNDIQIPHPVVLEYF